MRGRPLPAARSQFDQRHAGQRQRHHRNRAAPGRHDRDGRDAARVRRGPGAMILDRRQARWAAAAALITVAAVAIYLAYAMLSPDGPRGGSAAGLIFAALGTGVIVFECLLGLRK